MTKPKDGEVNQLDRLIQENEQLRAENEELKGRLEAAQTLLKTKWKECSELLVVFGEAPAPESGNGKGDPLSRFRAMLEKAPRESYRRVAQAVVDLGGRATIKQLVAATQYSDPTVRSTLTWLNKHLVTRKDGHETVLAK